MGTRADFYVGSGPTAEWIGSVAWDGYPDGFKGSLLNAKSEAAFRKQVAKELASGRDDATQPSDGWPWPWDTSATTDYAYSFADGHVRITCFGRGFLTHKEYLALPEDQDWDALPAAEFPNMKSRAAVTFGKRSGIMILGVK